MRKMKKTTVVFLALMMLMIANFTVAAAYSYNFTIIRANPVYTSNVSKNKTANYGIVSVVSVSDSASGFYTRYCICNAYSPLEISDSIELQNVRGQSGHMDYANPYLIDTVRMKGVDNRLTAPNYSTVGGYWSPTQTLA